MVAGVVVVGLILIVMMSVGRKGKASLNKAHYQRIGWQSKVPRPVTLPTQQFRDTQADKLLDRALRESGYSGETMAERLTSASRVFSKRDSSGLLTNCVIVLLMMITSFVSTQSGHAKRWHVVQTSIARRGDMRRVV